jgi:Tfp pilus assembly protein PilP
MRLIHYLAIAMSLAACGDDDSAGGAGAGGGAAKPAAAAPAKPGAPLRQMTRVEDRATTAREKLSIRHPFKERDFAADQNRDPFQSYVLNQGIGTPDIIVGPKLVANCEPEKTRAGGYSYSELRLVGIIATGTQRKALVIAGNEGYTIKRLDCVGKEKAIVDEISDGYVRLRLKAEPVPAGAPDKQPETRDMELHPKELQLDGPLDVNRTPQVLDVPLPNTPPRPPAATTAPVPAATIPAPRTTPTPAPMVVPQPPTELKP